MPTLQEAQQKCNEILKWLEPVTENRLIVGSVRRKKPNPHDIEICCTPKMQANLFGENEPMPFWVNDLGNVVKNGPRYKQIELPEGYSLDLFIVYPPAQWGVITTIRTGPDTFSKQIVTIKRYGGLLPSTAKCKDGAIWNEGQLVPMPTETDLFEFLGLDWIEPEMRK